MDHNYLFITPDGDIIQVPRPLQKLYAMMCGCGDPASVWRLIKEYVFNPHEFSTRESAYHLAFAYMLNYADLTEHGTSINGAWVRHAIADDVKAFLEEFSAEELAMHATMNDSWGRGWLEEVNRGIFE